MNANERMNLTNELVEWKTNHPDSNTPMRDLFVYRYGAEGLTKAAILILWDDWCKVARMSGVSNVIRRECQWTENGIVVRDKLNILH